jgi:hypothetical protein
MLVFVLFSLITCYQILSQLLIITIQLSFIFFIELFAVGWYKFPEIETLFFINLSINLSYKLLSIILYEILLSFYFSLCFTSYVLACYHFFIIILYWYKLITFTWFWFFIFNLFFFLLIDTVWSHFQWW